MSNYRFELLFLWFRGFQHGPSTAHIEAQPIPSNTMLSRDTNSLGLIRTQEALYAESVTRCIMIINNNYDIF